MALKRFLRAQNSFNILILAKGYVPTASMPMHGSLVNTIDLEPPELKYYLFQILKSHANIKFGRLICPKYSKTLYKAIKIKYFERSSRTQKHPSLHLGIPNICQERQERREFKILAECKKIAEKNEKITLLGKYIVNLRTFRV